MSNVEIVNPVTNRKLKVGGPGWKKLMKMGGSPARAARTAARAAGAELPSPARAAGAGSPRRGYSGPTGFATVLAGSPLRGRRRPRAKAGRIYEGVKVMGENKRMINVNGPAFRALYKANPAEASRLAAGVNVDLALLFPGRGHRRAGSPRAARSPRRARSPRAAKFAGITVLNPRSNKTIAINGAAFRKLHNEHPSQAKRLAAEAGVNLKELFPGRGRPKSAGPAKKRKPVSPSKRKPRKSVSPSKRGLVLNPVSGKMITRGGRLHKKLMAAGQM